MVSILEISYLARIAVRISSDLGVSGSRNILRQKSIQIALEQLRRSAKRFRELIIVTRVCKPYLSVKHLGDQCLTSDYAVPVS